MLQNGFVIQVLRGDMREYRLVPRHRNLQNVGSSLLLLRWGMFGLKARYGDEEISDVLSDLHT